MAAAPTRTPRYLVLRTSDATGALPARCAHWAARTGTVVQVVGPVVGAELRSQLQRGRFAAAVLEIAAVRHDDALAATIAAVQRPTVAVDRQAAGEPPGVVETACAAAFSGRGTAGFLWALWHVHARHVHPPDVRRYGDDPTQVADLRLPRRSAARPRDQRPPGRHPAPPPVIALLHGGFWRHEWTRDLMDGPALDLTGRGYATWNVEYRRVGPTGGGWPQTVDDVVNAVMALPRLAGAQVDTGRVALLGHSAGAQLALRAAADLRDRGRPPVGVVALSGLFDLEAAVRQGVGQGAVEALLGGTPDACPDTYTRAAPIANLPLGVAQTLAHGAADVHVPFSQTARYAERARTAGDVVDVVTLADAGHFTIIDPTTHAWRTTAATLERRLDAM